MRTSFKNILIPVDFSANTELAVKKAMELADAGQSSVLLLHVLPSPKQLRYIQLPESDRVVKEKYRQWEVMEKLLEWRASIEQRLSYLSVRICISKGNVQEAIVRQARQLKADLVVIGKTQNHPWLPFLRTVTPSRIAAQSGCPVLTTWSGSRDQRIKTVVVPVAGEIPFRKMEAIAAICAKFKVKIFLVSFIDSAHVPEDFSAHSLAQVYQWLKTSVRCPVEYAVLRGRNKARSLMAFAENNHADILLVHPESETRIGWPNTHISDVLPATSPMQVLAVRASASTT